MLYWIRGYRVGQVWISPDGSGRVEAIPGRRMRNEDALLINLAGYAAECGPLGQLDFSHTKGVDDIERARALLTPKYIQLFLSSHIQTQEEALRHYWERAQDLLWVYHDHQETLAEVLLDKPILTGDEVAAVLDQYDSE